MLVDDCAASALRLTREEGPLAQMRLRVEYIIEELSVWTGLLLQSGLQARQVTHVSQLAGALRLLTGCWEFLLIRCDVDWRLLLNFIFPFGVGEHFDERVLTQ